MTFLHVSGLNVASIEADNTRSTASQLVRLDCSPPQYRQPPFCCASSWHHPNLPHVPHMVFPFELSRSQPGSFCRMSRILAEKNWWILTFVKSHDWYFRDPKYHWWVSPKWLQTSSSFPGTTLCMPWHHTLKPMNPGRNKRVKCRRPHWWRGEGPNGGRKPWRGAKPSVSSRFFRGIYGSFREGIKFTYIYCKMQWSVGKFMYRFKYTIIYHTWIRHGNVLKLTNNGECEAPKLRTRSSLEEEFLFTVRCLCSIQRRRSRDDVMGVDPISQFGKPKGYSRWALMEWHGAPCKRLEINR